MVWEIMSRDLLHDLEIGFIGAIGLAHVGHFEQQIDIGQLDVALVVRRRIARQMFGPEGRRIDADRLDRDEIFAAGAVERALESDGFARIRVGARGRAGRLRIGDIFRDDAQPRRLALEAGAGDAQRGDERIDDQSALDRVHQHLMKGARDVDVERMRPVDVARLHHFLFEIDGIARIEARPRSRLVLTLTLPPPKDAGWIWPALVVAIGRFRCDSTAEKGCTSRALIAGRVGVGDIGGDGRLPCREPARILRGE